MFSKILFVFSFIFSVNVYSINLPQIENNRKMAKTIKDNLQRALDDDNFSRGICETEFYGISSYSFIEDIEMILKKMVIKRIKNGNSYHGIIHDINKLGYELSDVIESNDLKEALEVGIYKVFEDGYVNGVKDYINLSKKYNISLIISPEKLNKIYLKGIANVF